MQKAEITMQYKVKLKTNKLMLQLYYLQYTTDGVKLTVMLIAPSNWSFPEENK